MYNIIKINKVLINKYYDLMRPNCVLLSSQHLNLITINIELLKSLS